MKAARFEVRYYGHNVKSRVDRVQSLREAIQRANGYGNAWWSHLYDRAEIWEIQRTLYQSITREEVR